MKNKDLLIAVDIALNTSGYAILDNNKKLYSTGLIETKKHWDYYKKLSYLYDEFQNLFVQVLDKSPSSITLILEGRLKGGFSGQTLASIEGARVASYLAYDHTCKQYEIDVNSHVHNPNDVKYHFSKKRAAKKDLMYKAVTSQFSFLKKLKFQEDIFDAIYLALFHIEKEPK